MSPRKFEKVHRTEAQEQTEFVRRIANGNEYWNCGDDECSRIAAAPDGWRKKDGYGADIIVFPLEIAFEAMKNALLRAYDPFFEWHVKEISASEPIEA